MICIVCGGALQVSNSRPQRRRNQVWRRRHCPSCRVTYTSTEALDLSKIITVAGLPFSRDKLFISLYDACRHRPTAIADAGGLTDTIIARLLPAIRQHSLDVTLIATICHETLRRFDHAAAVQYRAYHR